MQRKRCVPFCSVLATLEHCFIYCTSPRADGIRRLVNHKWLLPHNRRTLAGLVDFWCSARHRETFERRLDRWG
ncbi:hypothetical protein BU24DRAFT_278661 [Aaosphaeria arxii CBS 175.79]|uniref:Uncharacterized protein n=1 Tax=Aaosphaeria arxii CBS 175.79 TaxID=1450172 RepID=A0A6A5XDV6_9PLEO|nr:uncharacterized protein BU24DRAFT_278661 [Aaosphaeria arxii CBS 175.79]KAF2011325.1 hypothetical protein BU24DRAFT_278661 [Aaosphaeria arxii CBS 175.79]